MIVSSIGIFVINDSTSYDTSSSSSCKGGIEDTMLLVGIKKKNKWIEIPSPKGPSIASVGDLFKDRKY